VRNKEVDQKKLGGARIGSTMPFIIP